MNLVLLYFPSTEFVAQRYHTFLLYYMFLPDGAIFRYIRSYNHLFLFLLLSLHWPVLTH
jgi:hypothetical protein